MTGLSDKAFATMAVCKETKRPFGITVDYIGPRHYKFVWAFKIDKDKAHREGYDEHTVTGSVELDSEGSPDKPGGEIPQTKRKVIHLHHEHTRTFSIGAVDSAIRDTFKL